MRKSSGVNYGKTMAQRSRRERVIVMLEQQLKRQNKKQWDGELVPLTDFDVKRINKELLTLKSRL
jgi:hypothetical protein